MSGSLPPPIRIFRNWWFRQDLFYRINVVKPVLPPLRERREDIPLLVEHFIRKFSRLSGKEIQGLSPDVFPLLMYHDFPGNVQELENIIEYATVVCKNGMIGLKHLPGFLKKKAEQTQVQNTKGRNNRPRPRNTLFGLFSYH
jgi:transcriptional regulator with PAS, ATPase and Fis domain